MIITWDRLINIGKVKLTPPFPKTIIIMNVLRGLSVFLCIARLLANDATASARPPNILYIFSDDQSYRTVSAYPRSYNFANTPNIDRLAEQGVRFDQAYIGAKCVPSRATALTGRLQFAVESNYDGSDIQGNTYWFPTLRNKGYYMGMIGKWHYGAGAAAHQHGTSWDWSVVWDHGSYSAAGGYYYDQKVMINGAPQIDLGGYSTDRYTDYTEQFIYERAEEPEQPWFYWLAYAGVHGPYTPADRHIDMLENEPETEIPVDVWGPRFGKPLHFQDSKWQMGADGMPVRQGKTLDFWVKQQTEAVASIDESVGRIVQALEDTGQLENTIIIFTADQGYVWGHHGLKGKIDPYETAIRSPFIVSNPARFPTNKVCKAPINGPDVIRTFHAWAGAEPVEFMPGRDITPLIESPESETVLKEWAEVPTMMTYVHNRYEPTEMANRLRNEDWEACMYETDTPWYFLIVVENYKYTRYANPDRIEELYDLDADPEELDNLAIKPQFKSKVLEMRAACIQSIKDNGGSVFADYLPEPTTKEWWPPNLVASDNAHVLHSSSVAQDDSQVLKTKNGWGSSDSRLAYLRFDVSDIDEIDGHPVDSILSVSLDLWMTQTEGDAVNDLQIYALIDGAQNAPSDLSETEWTASTGAAPLLGTNLPTGNTDPASNPLSTTMLGSHTFPATGDNTELGLVQIQLSISDLKTLINNDTNREITLIVRSTSQASTVDFAAAANSDGDQTPPALTVIALPTPPTGLNATGLNETVLLDWDDHSDPNWAGYKVYRATSTGAYGAAIASGLTTSTFIDDGLANDTTFYYVITAVDSEGNESNQSSEVSATPEEAGMAPATVLFGSANQGLAGFTQSSGDSSEIWSMQADSVRYRNQDTGTRNSSLLREFPVNRTDGNIYNIEGFFDLTDGYADDNNRVGIYLFGDSSVVPDEDETGALCLLINLDDGMLRLTEGIDKDTIAETSTGRANDSSFFGNTLKFTASITFIGNNIQIIGVFTDELNTSTTLSATVSAPDYTGNYFGFATRTRSRNYGVSGDARSAPFVVDYQRFYLSWENKPLDDFEQWAQNSGIGSDALAIGDFDGDGISNIYEYGLDGDPSDSQNHGTMPTLYRIGDASVFVYPKRSDTDTLVYTVQTSLDLKSDNWSATRYTEGETDVTDDTLDFVTVYIDTDEDRLFIRLKIQHK